MDVIGNNIANVNTPGFKRSRVTFNEVLAQLRLGVGRIAGGTGTNPAYSGRAVQPLLKWASVWGFLMVN